MRNTYQDITYIYAKMLVELLICGVGMLVVMSWGLWSLGRWQTYAVATRFRASGATLCLRWLTGSRWTGDLPALEDLFISILSLRRGTRPRTYTPSSNNNGPANR